VLALPTAAAGADAARPRSVKSAPGRPASITVSYADLIDTDVRTRTGRRLGDAVRDPRTPRAVLQPFLDGYSLLLPYVVEMVFGADPAPRREILDRWPAGSPQPAWVALFRGGGYRVVADDQGRVRLFIPGDDAAGAWRKHYPAIRHCLNALVGTGGVPLAVEVFAYRNDYRKQELRLALSPVTVSGTSFPPDRAPLDLASLGDFFRQGGQLEGAQIDPDEGLVLFANPDERGTLAGETVSLADLAVAYRAVFHAGDNDAFVSLDSNADPGTATVNFGGHLEDTRIGAAVLAGDRRFKTICSGLDPVSRRDARQEIRTRIPAFMTNSERSFLDVNASPSTNWITTRYWFYPESVSVDADPLEGFAVITRPRFTADAERTGKGFDTVDARKKRAALPSYIRENIRDMNVNFAGYAVAFPEIGDLAAVARLMAISIWLKRSEVSWLDLDALLAVELPAASTPRTLERIISSEYIAIPPYGTISEAMVKDRSQVTWMTPMLQRTVGDFFGNPRTFTGYLCAIRREKRPCSAYEAEAATLFEAQRGLPLRSLLRSEDDLTAFLEFLFQKITFPLPPEGEAARAHEIADEKRLEHLRGELAKATLEAAGEQPTKSVSVERMRLEAEIAAIMKRYHEGRDATSAWRTEARIQVNGGISLRPEEFTIRRGPASPALQKFKRLAQGASVEAGPGGGSGRLVRSRPAGTVLRGAGQGLSAAPVKAVASPRSTRPAAAPSSPAAAAMPASKGKGAVTFTGKFGPPSVAESGRMPALVTTRIAIPAGAVGAARALGELAADGRIVFRKSLP
jgi:hypothetical protein